MRVSKEVKVITTALFFLAAIGISSAHAAKCVDTTLDQAGPYPYLPGTVKYSVKATCNDTTPAWSGSLTFLVNDDDYAESLFASALTALATGNMAEVIVSSPAEYSVMRMCDVKKAP